jgi:hypothetical protein
VELFNGLVKGARIRLAQFRLLRDEAIIQQFQQPGPAQLAELVVRSAVAHHHRAPSPLPQRCQAGEHPLESGGDVRHDSAVLPPQRVGVGVESQVLDQPGKEQPALLCLLVPGV